MADTFDDLGRKMRRLADVLPFRTHQQAVRAATRALEYLVRATPVKTGKAQSNWQVGVNSEISGELEPRDAGSTISEGAKRIAAAKPGSEIILDNPVSYLEQLNAGSSRQAPAGFIEEAVFTAIAEIQNDKVVD